MAVHLKDSTCTWLRALPLVMLSLRTITKEDINLSPAELVFGSTLSLPPDLTLLNDYPENDPTYLKTTADNLSDAMRNLIAFRKNPRQNIDKIYIPSSLSEAKFVYVKNENRKALQPPYNGPFKILERPTNNVLKLAMPWGPDNISIDRVKPAPIEINADRTPSTQTNQNSSNDQFDWREGLCGRNLRTYSRRAISNQVS